MKKLTMIACVYILLFTIFTVFGAEKTLMKMSFEEGKVLNYIILQEQSMSQELMGQKIDTTMTSEMGMTMKIEALITEDQAVIVSQYDYIKMNMQFADQLLSFDSRKPEDDMMDMAEYLTPMIGKELRMTLSSSGEVLEITGLDEIMNDMPLGEMREQFSEIFNFEQMMKQTWSFYPGDPVAIGETWRQKMEMELPYAFTIDAIYEFTGQDENYNYLSMNGDMIINMDSNTMGLQMEGMEITMDFNGEMQQEMKVDQKTGWLDQNDSIMDIQGNMMMSYTLGDERETMQMPVSMKILGTMKRLP